MSWRWALLCLPLILCAETRRVGPGQRYRTPCEAVRAAAAGDVIEIDAAGDYAGDVCAFSPGRLTLRGVNGRPRIDAGGRTAQGKAIWVIGGGDVVVENIEFTGARCPEKNGAGIRFEGRRLAVRDCVFRNNENGILTWNDSRSSLLVEYSEFDRNGHGDGYSHNIYAGRIAEFTMQFCWSHSAIEGHLVKSRAAKTNLLYNFLSTGNGTASYEIDLPESGDALVAGNIIVQTASTHNAAIISAGQESRAPGPGTALRLVHNTIVDLYPGPSTILRVGPGGPRQPELRNNLILGRAWTTSLALPLAPGNVVLPAPAAWDPSRPGAALGALKAEAVPLPEELTPRWQYRHPACGARRPSARKPGAVEDPAPLPGDAAALPARCRDQSR
jgi:hypothetical protein